MQGEVGRLEWLVDPKTPAEFLPQHLRSRDNEAERTRLKIVLSLALRHWLKGEERWLIEQVYGNNRKIQEVAEELAVHDSTVSRRLGRVLHQLKEQLDFFSLAYQALEQEERL